MGFVNTKGEPWSPSDAAVKKKVRASPGPRQSYHKGYVVLGYPPGEIEKERLHFLSEQRRLNAYPTPWSEERWIMKNRPKRLMKPFEVESAANIAAEMAIKEGWQYVSVRCLQKGEPPLWGMF